MSSDLLFTYLDDDIRVARNLWELDGIQKLLDILFKYHLNNKDFLGLEREPYCKMT